MLVTDSCDDFVACSYLATSVSAATSHARVMVR